MSGDVPTNAGSSCLVLGCFCVSKQIFVEFIPLSQYVISRSTLRAVSKSFRIICVVSENFLKGWDRWDRLFHCGDCTKVAVKITKYKNELRLLLRLYLISFAILALLASLTVVFKPDYTLE